MQYLECMAIPLPALSFPALKGEVCRAPDQPDGCARGPGPSQRLRGRCRSAAATRAAGHAARAAHDVWRYLNRPQPDEADGITRRRSLLERWRAEAGSNDGASSVVTDTQIALIMGRGGQYTVDDLGSRDTLLDLLGASIATMNQQLQVLLDELAARGASRP